MAHFQFEEGINECLRKFEAPLRQGPVPRWQRKAAANSELISHGPFSPLTDRQARARTPRRLNAQKAVRAKTPHKTPSKTPVKTPKKSTCSPARVCGDRFIPSRTRADCEWSHFQVVQGQEPDINEVEMSEDSMYQEYGKQLAVNLKETESKIMHFGTSAPAAKEG